METIGLFLILSVVIVILLYFYSRQNLKYWKRRNVPYKEPVPFFGNVYKILTQKQSIGDFLSQLYNTSKHPILGFYLLEVPYLLIRDPKIIKRILVKDFEYFTDRSMLHNENDEYGRHLLFALPGPQWKELRNKLTPAFSSGKLKALIPLVNEVGEQLLNYFERNIDNERLDCRAACVRYGIDLIACSAFGINGDCLSTDNSEFYSMCSKFLDYTNISRAIQMVSYFSIPSVAKFFHMKFLHPKAARYLDKVVTDTISERIDKNFTRGDLIDILVDIQKREKDYVSDPKKLPVVAIQFLIGGYESSAGTITFFLYELSRNQSIQTKLREEINTVYEKHGSFSSEAIKEMHYLDMVLKEIMRMYPLLPFLDRRCVKTYQVPNSDLTIEKGTGMYASIYGLHHDPDYFPDPETFDPERFSPENKSSILSEAYMPFGYGIRNCIGARFAYLSIKLAIIKLLTKYYITKSYDTPDPLELASNWIFLAPKSKHLYLNFKKISA